MKTLGALGTSLALVSVGACGGEAATDAGVLDAALEGGASDVGMVALDAGDDAGIDAGPPVPVSITLASGDVELTIATDPARLSLTRMGAEVLTGTDVFLELGFAPGGSTRYHDPLAADPTDVVFAPIVIGVEALSPSEARVRDAAGRTARLSLTTDAEGGIVLTVTSESHRTETALVRLRLRADDGSYQGLGERFEGAEARGHDVPMQLSVTSQVRASGINEHHVPIPFLVSSQGYGVFAESREAGAVDVARAADDEVRFTFEGDVLSLHFFAAPSPRDVIAAYTRLTGLPRLPPRWAFAPMHWRNEWDDRAMLEEDLAEIDRLDIPTTSFWIDNPWQTSYSDMRFDESRFPSSAEMLAMMRARGFMPLVWNVPYLDAPDDGVADNPAEERFVEAERDGHLIRLRGGDVYYPPGPVGVTGLRQAGGMLDFTSSAAIDFWREASDPIVRDLGVRAFKLDYGEDIVPEIFGQRLRATFSDGRTEREVHNVYAELYHTPYRRSLDAHAGDEGGFLLVRASCYGGQDTADIVWPGDLDNDMRRGTEREVGGLPAAIAGMLSLAASGFPSFASDTGGYRGGMPTRDVLLRWAEQSAYSPFLQLGGGGAHHNPWLYDAEAGAIYRELARDHMSLVPFFRSLARRASSTGTPYVLHPALAFPDDRDGYADPDAYVIGDAIFVAPVVVEGATERALHLPPGAWVHGPTGMRYEGPRALTVTTPLGAPAVFYRVGTLLPLLPRDLETLVPASASRVDPADRPFLRARWWPAGAQVVELVDEGLTLRASHDATTTTFSVTPLGTDAFDVRVRVELAHASPALTTVGDVRDGATSLTRLTTLAEVESGCAGGCFAVEGGILAIALRGTSTRSVEIVP